MFVKIFVKFLQEKNASETTSKFEEDVHVQTPSDPQDKSDKPESRFVF